ncbi:MAG: hypothetical protein HYT76_02680 [Deltaproteobacteria bacterium]|nr:hypothetical protein [Deltaproteobacteria bacterium]
MQLSRVILAGSVFATGAVVAWDSLRTRKEGPPSDSNQLKELEERFRKLLQGIPNSFFQKDPWRDAEASGPLLAISRVCQEATMSLPQTGCPLFASSIAAAEFPDSYDLSEMRRWAIGELPKLYEEYLGQTPQERVMALNYIRHFTLAEILLTQTFGPPLQKVEMERLMEAVRRRTGKSHIPPKRENALTWEEVSASRDPVEVRIEEIPSDMQAEAREIPLSAEVAREFSLPENSTLWDFLLRYNETVVFAHDLPQSNERELLGELKSPFFGVVALNVESMKAKMGRVFPSGLLATLAHETYHRFYATTLSFRNELYVGYSTLNERNAHLLQADVLGQMIRHRVARGPSPDKIEGLIPLFRFYRINLLYGLAGNLKCAYPIKDRSIRSDLAPGFERQLFHHLAADQDSYFVRSGETRGDFTRGVLKELGLEGILHSEPLP